MGCKSSKYCSSDKDDEQGTIIVACLTEMGIVFGVDSRRSNEKHLGEDNTQWHLTINDEADKVFPMSSNSNIVAVRAGRVIHSKNMCNELKKKCDNFPEEYPDEKLSYVYRKVVEYIEGPEGENKEFGTLIAGWDEYEGFQICRLFIKSNQIVKDQNLGYASLGSGQHWANEVMGSRYSYRMTIKDAADLVLESLFYATLYDKGCGGILRVFHLDKEGCHQQSSHDALEAYDKFFDYGNEENTFFLVRPTTQQPFTSNDLITYFFRKYKTMAMAGHRVAHRVTKKQNVAFYLHGMVFRSTRDASNVYNQIVAENGQKSRPRDFSLPEIYKMFDYRVELLSSVHGRDVIVPVYVSWSSKDLLQKILSMSRRR